MWVALGLTSNWSCRSESLPSERKVMAWFICKPCDRNTSYRRRFDFVSRVAQFIGVCSSAKTCEIGENLLSVFDPISRLQERLIDAGALISPSTLQRRPVPSLHPYLTMERSSTPVSPLSEPPRRSLGYIPLPAGTETLPL